MGDQNREEAEVVARKTQQVDELREQILKLQTTEKDLDNKLTGEARLEIFRTELSSLNNIPRNAVTIYRV